MRAAGLTLALLLAVSACVSGDGASEREEMSPTQLSTPGGQLVDMDAGPGDLQALRLLVDTEDTRVTAVSLSLPDDEGCATMSTRVQEVLAQADTEIPIACGSSAPTGASHIALDDLDGELLGSLDSVLVLGPMTNVAALLDRLPEVPVTAVAGTLTDSAFSNLAADPSAARRVIGQQKVTLIEDAPVADLVSMTELLAENSREAAEVVAALLAVDETFAVFDLRDIEITDSGAIEETATGSTVRFLTNIDEGAVSAMLGIGLPSEQTVLEVPSPELRWQVDVGGLRPGTHLRAAVGDDVVIVGGGDGQVYGISPTTGEVSWTIDTGNDDFLSTVAYESGVAVASVGSVNPNGTGGPLDLGLVTVDVADRSVLWRFDPQDVLPASTHMSAPAVADGVVYAGTADLLEDTPGVVFALDLETGEPLWTSEGRGGPSEPRIAGDDLVVGGVDGILRVFNRHSGELRWEEPLVLARVGIASRPLVDNGVIYVTGDDGSVHALDQVTGEVIWRIQASSGAIPASPLLVEGRLIAAGFHGQQTRALDPATGEELWATEVGDVLGDPVAVGETVIVTTFRGGAVLGLDLETGERLWEFDNPRPISGSPVVVQDVLVYQAFDVFGLELPGE